MRGRDAIDCTLKDRMKIFEIEMGHLYWGTHVGAIAGMEGSLAAMVRSIRRGGGWSMVGSINGVGCGVGCGFGGLGVGLIENFQYDSIYFSGAIIQI